MVKVKVKKKKGRIVLYVLLVLIALFLGFRFLPGRWSKGALSGQMERVEISWEEATGKGGPISPYDLAVHYAPDLLCAVNTVISDFGRGDFLAACDFDGDWAADNNWEHMTAFPLKAVVYWSCQETETHYYLGYNFYHPRDDAEIWLDKHENDLEGIMLAIPKREDGFAAPEIMYTQGHGGVPFFFDTERGYDILEGSHRDGGLELDGDHAVIYITPNGTLLRAGHSVESAKDHSTYLYVGNSGVRYFHGGVAEEPAVWQGAYANNPCSYELRPLEELYAQRNGPYGDGHLFARYGAFRGNTYEKDAANPPWGWRNKNAFGLSGTFLTDPVWTIRHAVSGTETFSADYLRNDFADWRITIRSVGGETASVQLFKDGSQVSTDAWFDVLPNGEICFSETLSQPLWAAGGPDTVWLLRATDSQGQELAVDFEAEYLGGR